MEHQRTAWHPALLALPVAAALVVVGIARAGTDESATALAALTIAAWGGAGALLAARRPLCRLGIVLLGGTVAGAAVFVAGGDGAPALAAVAFHLLVALPRGDLPGARRGALVAAYVVAGGTALAVGAAGADPTTATWIAGTVAAAAGLPFAHRAYLVTAGLERQRLQWIGCAAAVTLEVAVVVASLHLLVGWPVRPAVVAGFAALTLPLALGAGASPKLATRADQILVHTVSFTGLTLCTIAVYVVVVIGFGQVPDGADQRVLGLSMLAAAVAAALYLPARTRLSDLANRLVYGERHAPDEVLKTFGTRLTRSIPMDELLLQLAESLKKTLDLRRAEVWTGSPELLERSVSVPFSEAAKLVVGDKERAVVTRAGVSGQAWASVWLPALLEDRGATGPLRVAPVTHAGSLLGLIVVERRVDGDAFGDDDDVMLAELARQVGLALHNVQLDSALQATLDEVRHANDELRASRSRIVATADAERRKIERNLHDGAQQHLVALAVNLRLLKDIVAEDAETAVEMLEQLAGDVKETIGELRALAHGIFPPLLVDAGLGQALPAAAARNPLDVSVEVDAAARYDAEVEAAVYFCCLEALQNAAKHAAGSSVAVRVWEEAGGLLFEITDDGPGFDAAVATRGHGFTNMSDRLGAIGGSVRWTSAPGRGSTVSGSIPLGGA